jgi:putative oxidoreductase
MKNPGGSSLAPHLLSLVRIVAACIFMAHGTQKMFGVPGGATHLPPLPTTMMGLAALLETVGGSLMLIGLYTRLVAFILSGEMAIAYVTQHRPRGLWPILNGGELAVLFCFLWLYFAAAGAGPWSVDRFRR